MSDKRKPSGVDAGRQRYVDRHGRVDIREREFDAEDLTDDAMARGRAAYAARHGNRSARDALRLAEASEPDNVDAPETE